MKTALICHADEPLNAIALPRWLNSFSELSALVIITENQQRLWKRIRREVKRVGVLRFADVLAFRLYYKLRLAARDQETEQALLKSVCERYPEIPSSTPVLETSSPNSAAAQEFLERHAPDILIARCKSILNERIFRIPSTGTFVMHPGVCPEYRNAHGCFWALANRDLDRVGMTLLKIDKGV